MAARRWDLLSFIPLLAIVALVALVASLVRIVPRSDDERTRAKLATDALWVEPTLRFQLAVDEDMLVRLAVDAASGTTLQITPCDRTTALLAAIVALAAFAVVALLILQRNARQGRHHGRMVFVIDITEAKRANRDARMQEDNLARTGRLMTMGEMALTLAHKLNQPPGVMAFCAAGGLTLIEAGQTDATLLKTAFEKLAAQARRAGLIIRRIRDFVKKRKPQPEPTDLAEVAADAVGLMAAQARGMRVRLALKPAKDPFGPVLADRIQIEQVMVNLIHNGMKATPIGPPRAAFAKDRRAEFG